jgi:hypothetical protein
MKNKVIINIGFNRAATTSLWKALEVLGYKGTHNISSDASKIFWSNVYSNKKLLSGLLHKYNAFLDHPYLNVGFVSLYFKQYPTAYFIYTKRNHGDRYDSTIKGIESLNADVLPSKEKWEARGQREEHIIDYIIKQNPNIKVLKFNVCEEGHGWKELCRFLGEDIPNYKFPHMNRSEE